MAKKKKKEFAVGDTVFAVDPHGKIVEATIRAIDPESMSPYELNLDTKFRYYTLDQLYRYREEAEVELVKEDSQRMLQAMKHGDPCDGSVSCGYDKKTHTFLDNNGKRISEYFEATDEELAEYNKLISKVTAFCHKHAFPFFATACVFRNKKDRFGFVTSFISPGPRTPDVIFEMDDIFQDMDDSL